MKLGFLACSTQSLRTRVATSSARPLRRPRSRRVAQESDRLVVLGGLLGGDELAKLVPSLGLRASPGCRGGDRGRDCFALPTCALAFGLVGLLPAPLVGALLGCLQKFARGSRSVRARARGNAAGVTKASEELRA